MLVENELAENDVLSFKLSSGEELISRFVKKDSAKYIVKNPMIIVAGPNGLGMTPFMFSVDSDSKFTLFSENIICVMHSERTLAKQYVSQISGLVL